MARTKYRPRTEIDGPLDLDSMNLYDVVEYALNHPGTHYELAQHIGCRFPEAKKSALLETAALIGALDEPIFRILQSDSI